MDDILRMLGFQNLREVSTLLFTSAAPLIIVAFLRHYHRLRTTLSEKMHEENKSKLEENKNKLIEVATDLDEIKRAQSHTHECLEDLKGRVASNNSHEARIQRLEEERMVRRRAPVKKTVVKKR